jgi:hypothetical protein
MFRNKIINRLFFALILIIGFILFVNYLDLSPKSQTIIKKIPNDIIIKVK